MMDVVLGVVLVGSVSCVAVNGVKSPPEGETKYIPKGFPLTIEGIWFFIKDFSALVVGNSRGLSGGRLAIGGMSG